jgi:RNA-directed DNA polymerase
MRPKIDRKALRHLERNRNRVLGNRRRGSARPCQFRPRATAAPLSVGRPFVFASNESYDTQILPFASHINYVPPAKANNCPFKLEVTFCVRGAISPLLANLYMNRFLKHWRCTGRGEAYRAHVISYADDFVILSRGHADEALAWTRMVMSKLGLALNETKTVVRNARHERFDFLGYSFGPHHYRKDGHWYLGASPSKKSVQRLKAKVSNILVPGNTAGWLEVRDQLNRLVRGWSTYFCYGTRTPAYRAVDNHVYERVRRFLVRRHKVPSRGTGLFPREAVFGALGVLHLRRIHLGPRPCALE